MNIRKLLRRARRKLVVVGASVVGLMLVNTPVVFAATTDINDIIQDWMPTIISFAMLGMMMGFLKKFGGRR